MNENRSKRREWVKSAAIVFLSVLLVLTFFSQTILNHSLPEVATKYVQSGSITSKIRGSGVVESGDPYVVEIPSQYVGRKVTGISYRVGDKVEKGAVLFTLAEGDGAELQAAKEALELARNALDNAQEAYDNAILTATITSADINSANANISASAYRKMITNKQDELNAAKDKVTPLEQAVAQLEQAITDCNAQIGFEERQNGLAVSKVSTAQTVQTQAQNAQASASDGVTAAQDARDGIQAEMDALDAAYDSDPDREVNYPNYEEDRAGIIARLEKADEALAGKKAALAKADEALSKANKDLAAAVKEQEAREASSSINNINKVKAEYEVSKYSYEKQRDAARAEVDRIQNELNDLISMIGDVSNLQSLQDNVNSAKKIVEEKRQKVEELSGENSGSEVISEIAGTITSINVTSGKTIESRDVMVLQPEGQGYFMSFSVSNDQAKTVSVGDKASLVNSWYYNDMDITLTSIKPDRTDPAKNKLLTFSIEGDVMVGQSLNVSVGQKNQNYELIVPNSAVRSDNNGDYVLIVESKSSPLGNRYIATRVDVTVLAKDDTQSAISGAISGWEYVITTSSAPVKPGDQVRIADN